MEQATRHNHQSALTPSLTFFLPFFLPHFAGCRAPALAWFPSPPKRFQTCPGSGLHAGPCNPIPVLYVAVLPTLRDYRLRVLFGSRGFGSLALLDAREARAARGGYSMIPGQIRLCRLHVSSVHALKYGVTLEKQKLILWLSAISP